MQAKVVKCVAASEFYNSAYRGLTDSPALKPFKLKIIKIVTFWHRLFMRSSECGGSRRFSTLLLLPHFTMSAYFPNLLESLALCLLLILVLYCCDLEFRTLVPDHPAHALATLVE